MATIPSYKVDVYVFGNDTAISFDDADGAGSGKAAYDALQGQLDINAATENGRVFVPFHAVAVAELTITQEEYTKPADANCPEEEAEPGEP